MSKHTYLDVLTETHAEQLWGRYRKYWYMSRRRAGEKERGFMWGRVVQVRRTGVKVFGVVVGRKAQPGKLAHKRALARAQGRAARVANRLAMLG